MPLVTPCPPPGEQRVCIRGTLEGCKEHHGVAHLPWQPLGTQMWFTALSLNSSASTAGAAAPSVGLGRLGPQIIRSGQHLLNSYSVPLTRCSSLLLRVFCPPKASHLSRITTQDQPFNMRQTFEGPLQKGQAPGHLRRRRG